jgi:hypothetical protein
VYIVFLNLADTQGSLTRKSVNALGKKYVKYTGWNLVRYHFYNNLIEEFDLIALYKKWKMGNRDLEYIAQMNKVLVSCGQADKIMLGVHGNVGDTDNASIEDFGKPSIKVACEDLAAFFLECLPQVVAGWWGSAGCAKRFHVALITCFGARARAHEVDHTAALRGQDVKSSFAYKLYKRVCLRRSILMTARTGSVAFDENTGRSLVQTEEAVQAEAEFNALQDALETKKIAELHENLWMRSNNRPELRRQQELIAREIEDGRTDWSMASGTELILIKHQMMRRKIQKLTESKDQMSEKQGKFVYSFEPKDQKVAVMRKYPKREIIYYGPL